MHWIRALRLPPWVAQHAADATDVAVAVGLAAVAALTLATAEVNELTGRGADPLAYGVAMLLTLPLVVRRRWPVAVFVVVLIGMIVFNARQYAGLNVDFFGPVLAFYTLVAHRPRRISVPAALLLMTAVMTTLLVARPNEDPVSNVLTTALIVAGVWFVGDTVRTRRTLAERLAAQAEDLRLARLELADRAVSQERLRIARELHDVVAHHMSAIVVQAAVAQDRLVPDPSAASRAIAQVEGIGRDALREMRHILGVLRQAGEEQGALDPAPSLSNLEPLYAHVRDGGLTVEVSVDGNAAALPPAIELAAYRIVQEALTNALRHAPGARVQVSLHHDPSAVRVEVSDDGGTNPPSHRSVDGAGQGIVGMRERVALLRGSFEAGPRAGGGFRVAATLPLEGAR